MSHPTGYRFPRKRSDRKVIRRSLIDFPTPTLQQTPCRLWQGSTFPNGYGRTWDPDRQSTVGAHRWVWEQINGPTDLDVLHKCDQPLCYRLDHLFIGTAGDNARDMMTKGRGNGQFRPGNYPSRWLTS